MGETERQLGAVLTILRMFAVLVALGVAVAIGSSVYDASISSHGYVSTSDARTATGKGIFAAVAVGLPIALVALLAGRKKGG